MQPLAASTEVLEHLDLSPSHKCCLEDICMAKGSRRLINQDAVLVLVVPTEKKSGQAKLPCAVKPHLTCNWLQADILTIHYYKDSHLKNGAAATKPVSVFQLICLLLNFTIFFVVPYNSACLLWLVPQAP